MCLELWHKKIYSACLNVTLVQFAIVPDFKNLVQPVYCLTFARTAEESIKGNVKEDGELHNITVQEQD